MSRNGLRLSVLGVALLLIAGCGGSSGGGAGNGGSGGGNGGGSGDQATTVTFSFIGGTPTVVAVKIGSGNHTAQNLTSGKLTISIPAGTTTYSVAYVCTGGGNTTVQAEYVLFESTQDGSNFTKNCPMPPEGTSPAMGTLTGTVDASAFPTAAIMEIDLSTQGFLQIVEGPPNGSSFQVTGPVGSNRVLIGLYDNLLSNLLQ